MVFMFVNWEQEGSLKQILICNADILIEMCILLEVSFKCRTYTVQICISNRNNYHT